MSLACQDKRSNGVRAGAIEFFSILLRVRITLAMPAYVLLRGKDVLGAVMGTMVEQNFVTSLIKSDGSVMPFFSRPVAAVLAFMTILAVLWPLAVWLRRKVPRTSAA